MGTRNRHVINEKARKDASPDELIAELVATSFLKYGLKFQAERLPRTEGVELKKYSADNLQALEKMNAKIRRLIFLTRIQATEKMDVGPNINACIQSLIPNIRLENERLEPEIASTMAALGRPDFTDEHGNETVARNTLNMIADRVRAACDDLQRSKTDSPGNSDLLIHPAIRVLWNQKVRISYDEAGNLSIGGIPKDTQDGVGKTLTDLGAKKVEVLDGNLLIKNEDGGGVVIRQLEEAAANAWRTQRSARR